ncbi:peptide-methionine (S)-S-oxide reductase MsrA [Polynucleobacter sp. AP-Jannik-300A-C4]|uniref:peptide-methionine (S)-S-oxide reductase MsrA n=1 Tax=Polynucleobacter sp. AP-Jannik-300A-C4 TaxID=2576928 RepID=UPI001BFE43C2|nr:peptide-methionine (S)-S-oxide reductase MsrA [Polynucleobacter sp. AP-Jannik-300A-C4]QWE23186.1 peptide-methionine (S)-S-oxide reductase MsrA [Polynucleobacter sp. AP-Jannik-300A-C4]
MNNTILKNDLILERATLGGGCFWCLEAVYQQIIGVSAVVSGYAGGALANPDYESVCSGQTGHAEIVDVYFDPTIVSYRDLLEIFFVIHDPTTLNYQGNDHGTQYRSVIFIHSESQNVTAHEVVKELENAKIYSNPVVTQIDVAPVIYPAEDYHQDYFRQHPGQGYCRAVVAPKLAKFRAKFQSRIAPEFR